MSAPLRRKQAMGEERLPPVRPGARVRVRVPATTANLGPGFDTLGMALTLYNRFDVTLLHPDDGVIIEATGPQADLVPTGPNNLVARGAEAVWNTVGLSRAGWRVRLETEIPLGGGLGSSASAIVGGIVAANALAGNPLSRREMLQLATIVEGHPDNVAPALLGGVTVVVALDDGAIHWEQLPADGLHVIVAIPDQPLSTGRSRQVLPETVPRTDAVFNVGRASLLAAALANRNHDGLAAAFDDRLHQPYRARLVPGFADVVSAARREGALGAVLSGAGPSVVAFASDETSAEPIGIAMASAFLDTGIGAHWLVLTADTEGAVVEATGPKRIR